MLIFICYNTYKNDFRKFVFYKYQCNIKKLHDYHFHMIANDKIFFLPGKLGAFSDVHTKSDITAIMKSTDNFLTKFKK